MSKVLTKIASAAALVAIAGSAQATLLFEVSQFGGTVGNELNLCNSSTLAGCTAGEYTVFTDFLGNKVVQFSAIVGDYAVSSTSTTSNTPGTEFSARVSTTALSVSRVSFAGGVNAQLFIGVRAFNFSQPDGIVKTLTGSSGMSSPGGTGSGSITSSFWADADNLGNAVASTLLTCTYPLSSAASCDAGSRLWDDPAGSGGGLFSLRSEHSFKLANGSLFEGTTSLIAGKVPEPMTASLVGVALLGLALASKRKAKAA
jgi:hypothetical protein